MGEAGGAKGTPGEGAKKEDDRTLIIASSTSLSRQGRGDNSTFSFG